MQFIQVPESAAQKKQIKNWSELGVSGAFANKKVMAVSSDSSSFVNAYFKQRVMLQDSFLDSVNMVSDTNSLFDVIAANDATIGVGPVVNPQDLPADVKMLKVQRASTENAKPAELSNILSGKYPLSRMLNVYIVRYPGKPLEKPLSDFLSFVLSNEGQQIVKEQGLIPLPAGEVSKERSKI